MNWDLVSSTMAVTLCSSERRWNLTGEPGVPGEFVDVDVQPVTVLIRYHDDRSIAAHFVPTLFSELILIDPVIAPKELSRNTNLRRYVAGAVTRRMSWSSRYMPYSPYTLHYVNPITVQ